VTIFLRGGADLLSLVAPIDGSDRGHYLAARPQLALPVSGDGALLPLGAQFGLHAAAAPLHTLFQGGKVAIVHACGMNVDTRSHFPDREFIELGTPDPLYRTGWITRHPRTALGCNGALMPSWRSATRSRRRCSATARRCRWTTPTTSTSAPGCGCGATRNGWRCAGCTGAATARRTAPASGDERHGSRRGVRRRRAAVTAPSTLTLTSAATCMIGQIIRLGIGLRAVTIDPGGWDTHEN
jgi:uncharacterized protein (DUF1501 family)